MTEYAPPPSEPYSLLDKLLLLLALPSYLFTVACLSQTQLWMATRSSRRRLLLVLIALELAGAVVIVGSILAVN